MKIKYPIIQSFDKSENKKHIKKGSKHDIDLEEFMKIYKSKSKFSIGQFKKFIH